MVAVDFAIKLLFRSIDPIKLPTSKFSDRNLFGMVNENVTRNQSHWKGLRDRKVTP